MVNDNPEAPTQDAIDQEQKQLDDQQTGSTEETQFVTVAQHNSLQQQIRTIQGMVHKGLNTATNNAIQGAKQYTDAEMAKLNRGAAVERIVSAAPEEHQEWVRPLINAALTQQQSQVQPQVTTGTGDGATQGIDPEVQALWDQWFDMAREWGLEPNDKRIQWNLVTDGDYTPTQRLARVNKHFANLVNTAPAKPVPPQATQQSIAPAPPVEDGPGPSTFADGTFEAALDQRARGAITTAQLREMAAKNGWQV